MRKPNASKHTGRSASRFLLAALVAGLLVAGPAAARGGGAAEGGGAPAGEERPERVDVLIGFIRTPGAQERRLVRGHGGTVRRSFTLVPAVAATMPAPAVEALSRDRRVTVVEPDGEFHIIDHDSDLADELVADEPLAEELERTWGVHHVRAGWVHAGIEAADIPANTGFGIGLAVFDTGIDYGHTEFAHNYVDGYDFHNDNDDPFDGNGHGTHVAGTAAAARDGAGVVGAAPDVHLYALKVLSDGGSGSFSSVIAALDWCVEHNAGLDGDDPMRIRVTNHSYGSGRNPGTIVEAAFDNARTAGILHVAAAGNSGNPRGNGNNVGYPARYDSVVAVAATDEQDNRASFSSTGSDVELAAPGVRINSTLPDGEYEAFSGTSMASPHVAGVAALVWSSHTYRWTDAPLLDHEEVRAILAATARPLGDERHYGFGLIDAVDAVALALDLDDSGDSNDDPDDPSGDPEPGAGVVRVPWIEYRDRGRHLDITMPVVDEDGLGIPGAAVAVDVWHDSAVLLGDVGTTGDDGTVSFRVTHAPDGFYETQITGVDAGPGWEWDGQTPPNGHER